MKKFTIAFLVVILVLAWITAHSVVTVAAGWSATPRSADVAVVLGTRVERSGVPSRRLRERLDRALDLYRAGTVKKVLVSGGLGREGHQEADVMRGYLLSRDVPGTDIYVDREGFDTYATARSTRAIMQAERLTSAVVVSHYYHLPRALVALGRFGVPNVSAAPVMIRPSARDLPNILREFFAFYFYLFRDYGTA
jgi:vancomycin permeability regulator SanA